MMLRCIVFVYCCLILTGCSKLAELRQPEIVHQVILDADPAMGYSENGFPRDIDDVFAIIQAVNTPNIEVRGITVVFGNSPSSTGFKIANRVVEKIGKKIPVYEGAARKASTNDELAATPAVEFMKRELEVGKRTIVAVGPLTNVAALLHHYPSAAQNLERVFVVMGRSIDQQFYIGENGPLRDFNFVMDPFSAQVVFNSGVPIVLAPFEISHRVDIEPKHLERILLQGTPTAHYVYSSSQAWMKFWLEKFPTDKGFHPWDSLAVAALSWPEMLNCEKRGFRFIERYDKGHGVSNAATGKKEKLQPWIETDVSLPGKKVVYCKSVKASVKRHLIKYLVDSIY